MKPSSKLLDRLERRFGKHLPQNLTLWLVALQAFVYLADQGPGGGLIHRLQLVPTLVLQGEVWRLLTYTITPPRIAPLGMLFYVWAFYYFGSSVESIWGTFRYGVYLLIGFVLTAAAAFITPDLPASGMFVKTSVFLAFATLLPEAVIHVMLILPLKARWLAAFTWALYVYAAWVGNLGTRLTILAAVSNFFLFFWSSALQRAKQTHRRKSFQKKVQSTTVQHECRVCGLTSDMAPRTPFRYCSQCVGQSCYCPDHLKEHEHVV